MSISIGELILQADAAMSGLGHAPSTRMQYRWAWSQFASFCSERAVAALTDEVVASYLQVVATEHRDGQMKEWKRKLLRKSTLVLVEVERTGSYRWALSRQTHPNDALAAVFRPVQEQYEKWLESQRLAVVWLTPQSTDREERLSSWPLRPAQRRTKRLKTSRSPTWARSRTSRSR